MKSKEGFAKRHESPTTETDIKDVVLALVRKLMEKRGGVSKDEGETEADVVK